ncbi:MAG: ImmA/IrrE family metallo-endopeptidase [Conexivisphaerales archaeon]
MQKVELYRDIMMQLSLSSREAVIAHELAHAWLNDNIAPDDSATREEECDALAEKWGFVDELRALADETE